MRFMMIVKATQDTEKGLMPSEKLLAEMAKYHEELQKAGVLLDASGLKPSSTGWRVKYAGAKRSVIDGPFTEAKELIAGFWLWQVKSKEEAIEWAKRSPFREGEVEIRQVFEAEDFGRELTPDQLKVKRIGALTIGVGSALDEKYLILFEGPSARPEDDMIVEAKQIRELAGNPCVRTDVGASRVLDGQRLISYDPFAYAAVVPHGGKYFWMHDWTDDYQEASIASAIRSPKDLRQIAYDVGVQMGRGHPKRPDGGQDKERRRAVLHSLDLIEGRLRIAMRELAGRTDAAWREFRQGAAAQ